MKIGVLGNVAKIKDENIIVELIAELEKRGYKASRFSLPTEVKDVDVVIVLGGDGAILHAALPAARNNVKIIGINYGNLGFLTEYEKGEANALYDLLASLEKGECRILKRTLLEIDVYGKIFYALNEVSLQRDYGLSPTKSTQILRVEMDSEEGKEIVSGDGLLLCTPTGSTAYSLSAGGAILTPEVPVFMMTPICAFSMRARPTVFSDCETFTLQITRGKGILLADGASIALLPQGTKIKVKKAPFTADFPVRENSDFFTKVRNKLNE